MSGSLGASTHDLPRGQSRAVHSSPLAAPLEEVMMLDSIRGDCAGGGGILVLLTVSEIAAWLKTTIWTPAKARRATLPCARSQHALARHLPEMAPLLDGGQS
jgi:hypothetical protein